MHLTFIYLNYQYVNFKAHIYLFSSFLKLLTLLMLLLSVKKNINHTLDSFHLQQCSLPLDVGLAFSLLLFLCFLCLQLFLVFFSMLSFLCNLQRLFAAASVSLFIGYLHDLCQSLLLINVDISVGGVWVGVAYTLLYLGNLHPTLMQVCDLGMSEVMRSHIYLELLLEQLMHPLLHCII